MSIEQAIIDNTAALNRLAAVWSAMAQQPAAPVAAPVAGAVVGQIVATAAPAMPAPPSFTMPPMNTNVTAAAPAGAPFTDAKGLMEYTMASYQEMGATKGAGIQGVLTSLGIANVNDIQPGQYAQFYAGVEALKRG